MPSQACLDPPPGSGTVIARVGTITIGSDQIQERLEAQGSMAASHTATAKALQEFVEDQIRFELLAQAALERGMARDPEVVDAARKVMVRKLLQNDLAAAADTTVEEEDLLAYYNKHQQDYMQPAKHRVSHIQTAPTVEGQLLAQNLIADLNKHQRSSSWFTQLATRYSLDAASRARGGDLQFKSDQELSDEFGISFADAVRQAEPGKLIATPVQSMRGWHVLLVITHRQELAREFKEVREEIRERLMQDKRARQFEKYLIDIRQRYPVAIYEDRLKTLAAGLRSGKTGAKNER